MLLQSVGTSCDILFLSSLWQPESEVGGPISLKHACIQPRAGKDVQDSASMLNPLQQHSSVVFNNACLLSVACLAQLCFVGIVFEARDRKGELRAIACLLLVVCLV